MDMDNAGDTQLPTAKQPQRTEARVPGLSTNNGVKVLEILCGGAIKVITPKPETQNACHASRHSMEGLQPACSLKGNASS